MEYDAITAGVEPGGINNSQQARLLVCYTLRAVKEPVEQQLLPELLQYHSIANFFEIMQAVDELISKGNVVLDSKGRLVLTEQGAELINEWEFVLPLSVKEKAARAAVSMMTKLKIARENKVVITPSGNGFDVACTVLDGEQSLLEIKLWVPDKAQAEAVKASFLDDPLRIYSGAITLLTDNQAKN